jgi:hypothetical protein
MTLSTIVGSLIAETQVTVSSDGGSSTFFGKRYGLVVSPDATKIYSQFNPTQ